ncbi:hypothetical protein M2167_000622 [Streptomyces sp. SPB4]|uniref:hypothetical protein n=1 Tax=Streptomyces lavendulae TaxID=1914 RepID=UPI00247C33C1|nr:hypothetical protein [Streptomyces sp. SPB4]
MSRPATTTDTRHRTAAACLLAGALLIPALAACSGSGDKDSAGSASASAGSS